MGFIPTSSHSYWTVTSILFYKSQLWIKFFLQHDCCAAQGNSALQLVQGFDFLM